MQELPSLRDASFDRASQAVAGARRRTGNVAIAVPVGEVAGRGFVVVGPPAAGKSTVARLLACSGPAGVHVPVDQLRDMVVSGLVLPGEHFSQPLVEQVGAARRVALAALSTYTAMGFTTVLDDFLDPSGLREYDDVVDSGAATGVVLRPDREVAMARARQREATEEGAAYICMGIAAVFSCLDEVLPRLHRLGWRVLDNTDLNPQETVTAILGLAGESVSHAPKSQAQAPDRPQGRTRDGDNDPACGIEGTPVSQR